MMIQDQVFRHKDLCHVGFVVPDMNAAIDQWQALGAAVVIAPRVDPIQNVTCAFLIAHDFLPVELVAPTGDGTNPLKARLKKGGGLDHVCCFTDDVEAAFDVHVKEGAVPLVRPVFGEVWNRTIAFVFLPTGLTLELMSRATVRPEEPDPLDGFFLKYQ